MGAFSTFLFTELLHTAPSTSLAGELNLPDTILAAAAVSASRSAANFASAAGIAWISEQSPLEPRESRSSVALRLDAPEPPRLVRPEPPPPRPCRRPLWLSRRPSSSWLLRLLDRCVSSGRFCRLLRLEARCWSSTRLLERWSWRRSMLSLLLWQEWGRLCFSSSSWSACACSLLFSTTENKDKSKKNKQVVRLYVFLRFL